MINYISRDKLIEDCDYQIKKPSNKEVHVTMDEAFAHFKELILLHPTADAQEVKHAHWECVHIDYDVRYNMVTMWCPACEKWHSEAYCYGNPTENINYCPRCGAIMDGKEKE